MPKARVTKDRDESAMREALADVFQTTSKEDRITLARHWLAGNFSHYEEFAESRHLLPIAVIIAALDEASHPIIDEARTYAALAALIIRAEIRHGGIVHSPVDNSMIVHSLEPAFTRSA